MKRRPWIVFLCCCALGIFGGRAFFIQQFGASVPLVHEWEATGLDTLAAWRDGTYTWMALLEPHNGDHPTVFTRLWEILWFEINGSWDPQLVMTAKAAVFAAAMTIFIHLLAGRLERGRFALAAALAALCAFPFNWHNLLWGVASQFDFFFLLAALGWLALQSGRAWLALGCAWLALFTNGAGPVVAASFVPYFIVVWRRGTWALRDALVGCGVAVFVVAFGLAMRTGAAEPHLGTWSEKAVTLAKLYAWPFGNAVAMVERLPESARLFPAGVLAFPSREESWLLGLAQWLHVHPGGLAAAYAGLALVIQAPWWALVREVRQGRLAWSRGRGVFSVGLLAGVMLGATALARAGQTTIAVRYLDHVALAGFAAIAAALALAARSGRMRRWLPAWLAFLAMGYALSAVMALAQMQRRYPESCLAVMQRYFATRDRTVLTKDDVFRGLVFDAEPGAFIALLNERRMQPVIPRAVIAPEEPRAWPAATAASIGQWSPLIVLFAAATAVWFARQAQRRTAPAPSALPATAAT